MINVTLKQMRYFEALSRHGHFGRAAAASAISQPALSIQIKELETDLGGTLFERGGRQVRLTPFGEEVAIRIRKILLDVEHLDEFARTARGALTGRFRLGIIPTIAPYLLPKLVVRLAETYPAVDLHVRETLTPRLIEELLHGKLDTAIIALPVGLAALEELPLFEEHFVLVRPQTEAGVPPPPPSELQDMRLLLLEEGHCFRDQTLAFCNAAAATPSEGLDGSSLSTLVQMVGAGLGVTMIPEMAVPIETRAAPVACTHFPDPQPGRTIGMIWRKKSPLSSTVEHIGEVARQAFQSQG
ncbi:MAG: LysR substrate-binding domain-containing protein [Pseudomonadota bacterium]